MRGAVKWSNTDPGELVRKKKQVESELSPYLFSRLTRQGMYSRKSLKQLAMLP
uniref:Uncharacterized protein n=1 Tax=Utricularia reniformis TaxID=192314 RepID=A0A1Y0AZR5_9LAMI|nr:hypothetical protein AEK19_MT0387 [Utricularia reniformis]ART30657.1 hypothetical protein AEK19_MT0387 [Utricularia reniformis]